MVAKKARYEVDSSTVGGRFFRELNDYYGNWRAKFPKNVRDRTSMIGYSPKRPYATAALQKNVPAVRIDNPLHADAFSVNGAHT
jgi:hypothetical protein